MASHAPVENARIELAATNPVIAYASVVDNATGDATSVLAKVVTQD